MSLFANGPTIFNTSTLYWKTKAEAQQAADQNKADDPEWSYRVAEGGRGFKVEIFDEDGEYLGNLA